MNFLGLGNFSVCGEVDSVFDKVAIREHFENLCEKVGVECKEHLARAQAATETRDWVVAYSEWSSCRDAILRSEGLLDRDERLWLLGCHALMSASLSAFHSMNFGRALTDAIAASKARDEVQIELEKQIKFSRECRVEAKKYAANKWEEGYEKYFGTSEGQSIWVRLAALGFLNEYHALFKTQYRQSYESGLPDESHFSNAESCLMKLLEPNFKFWFSRVQTSTFVQLVRLYHEKDRQVMFLEQSSNMVDVNPEKTPPILQYAKKAIKNYVEELIQHTKHDDYWIVAQRFFKDVYYMLQFHNFAVWIGNHGCTLDSTCDMEFPGRLQKLWNQSLRPEGAIAESSASQEIWKESLIWAEWQLARLIYFQLAPNILSAMEQHGEFDQKDDVAWNTLKSSRAACGPATVVLEYFVSEGKNLQFVYVLTKEDKVLMQILKIHELEGILRDSLEKLREMISRPSTEDERKIMDGYLEWLYEIFISPVGNLLVDMEEDDKLIIVAPEILSNVPFAALRKPNSPVGEGYLIQSHTISVTPSLRMLEHCNQHLKKLDQNVQLVTKPGTVVVVGDPTESLKKSGEEVNFIEKLFGKEHVKKLVGPEATPSEVLKWAKYPSENCVKQVVFHIAAHAIGQDDGRKVKKDAILLARPASSSQQNYGTAWQGAMLRVEDDEALDYDNAHDETELGDLLFSMVDVKEEIQISSHSEVGGIHIGIVDPISKHAADMLKAENISGCGFQWEADMVVLSGCETARGQITEEGVLNLPRALMIAGVPCVVVSQWKVGDSTCELMKGFYQELRSGKDVSSSLRAAMLKMMKDGGTVHEWAPFVVCGLPTVYLPTELQAGTTELQAGSSSCKGDDCGTSSDAKVEPRLAFSADFPCTTDGHLKQENQFPTIGISDMTENCLQTRFEEILTMGRKGKFEGVASIEFIFKQAEDMSKVIGVGLQWAKVVVTKQFGVVVKQIGEQSWFDLWKETNFSPMRIPILKPPPKLSMCNLTPKQASKRFGVGLMGSRLENNHVYVEENQNQTGEMFSFIFELAKKMGFSKNVEDSNFQQPSGISNEAVEGEKNDHGGPLLETVEGGGETDQGGTSSEPMNVGESSQGGSSSEPMEGVDNGQGGPSRSTEVGGQRDQQSSGFQLRFESLHAKGRHDSNENKSLTVIVVPKVGGVFYEADGKNPARPDSRIEGAAIAPWLQFKFEILGGERKITTTTNIVCDLGEGALQLHEDWNLAYCHDYIKVLLTCEDPEAVRVSPGAVDAMDVMKRTMTETSTGSTSRENQVSSQVNVGLQIPMVAIQGQGTLGVTNTAADSRALAVTTDSSNTQFAGFNVNDIGCANSLAFSFVYPGEIVDVKDRGQKEFVCAGISKTFRPVSIGTWDPLNRDEFCPYSFKTDRNIYSIGNLSKPKYLQSYVVQFLINHALSHIHSNVDTELRGFGMKSVDHVLKKFQELS